MFKVRRDDYKSFKMLLMGWKYDFSSWHLYVLHGTEENLSYLFYLNIRFRYIGLTSRGPSSSSKDQQIRWRSPLSWQTLIRLPSGSSKTEWVLQSSLFISNLSSRLQICGNGDKYQISQGGGSFTIVIRDPEPGDTGCYKCVLQNLEDFFCEMYLDVQRE